MQKCPHTFSEIDQPFVCPYIPRAVAENVADNTVHAQLLITGFSSTTCVRQSNQGHPWLSAARIGAHTPAKWQTTPEHRQEKTVREIQRHVPLKHFAVQGKRFRPSAFAGVLSASLLDGSSDRRVSAERDTDAVDRTFPRNFFKILIPLWAIKMDVDALGPLTPKRDARLVRIVDCVVQIHFRVCALR